MARIDIAEVGVGAIAEELGSDVLLPRFREPAEQRPTFRFRPIDAPIDAIVHRNRFAARIEIALCE